MEDHFFGWILVAAGLFSIAGGLLNWDWFLNSGRAWLVVKIFGRTGARGFYVLLGGLLVFIGSLMGIGLLAGG